ncbi:hypothetical protein BDV95DRAFT_484929 [Massariosphaeria phaeospora]|uniref:NADH dehydrogenase [ubiquinone] 1 alpha subcomplex assembly factor 3 n=1 Tax=Massariosphaeria phaeospora TaxID=100035 RepID=A0A7C8MSK7_9PLEO|nr:hypothetical protein BDV95DRAFT_484929 [Massariosphaeria phaeospora]
MERTLPAAARSLSKVLNPTARRFLACRRTPLRPIAACPPPHGPSHRQLHGTAIRKHASPPPKSRDRGPASTEDTQTDFGALDVLRNTTTPATAIDACMHNGFALNNQTRILGSGVLLVGGEAFRWRPWLDERRTEGTVADGAVGDDAMTGRLKNAKGLWEVHHGAWGILDLVWPKPDLLIIGTGPQVTPIAPAVRRYLNDLGIRLEIQDTRNAAAQFNLLATERGVHQVAAALIPLGWKEGR